MNEVIQTKVNIAIMEKYRSPLELRWSRMEKGLTNLKYLISANDKPIAICKIFTKTGIIAPEIRFEREKQALEIFGGSFAPKTISSDNPNVLVYEYVVGREFLKLRTSKDMTPVITETLAEIHKKSQIKKEASIEMVTEFYQNLISYYKNSDLSYPSKMVKNLQDIVKAQEEILDDNKENLTHIHGDLVPPNFIFRNEKVILIDWEFFRPELNFFDIAYFNYYAKAHKFPVELKMEDKKIEEVYNNLVDILEQLWFFAHQKKQEKLT